VETGISLVHTVAEGPPPAQGPFQLEVRLLRPLGGFPLRIAFGSHCRRLAVLGASGAGKSQLLRCLAGLERPASGRIALNGRTLFDAEGGIDLPLRRRRIGLVPQHYALFPHLTVAANVSFSLASLPRAERGRRVGLQLEHLGLSALAERYPAQLSGGQQQRVPWPGPWRVNLSCCCSMSPSPPRMPICGPSCSNSSPTCLRPPACQPCW